MSLVNEYRHNVDSKNRIFIPAKFRDEIGEHMYITRKTEGCLAIYSDIEWAKLADKLNAMPDSRVAPVKRFLYAKTISVTADTQGRVSLTPALLEHAGITGSAVIVGVGDHAQIWAVDIWEKAEEAIDLEFLQQTYLELGL